jgi:hypothetical protein
MNFDIDIWKDLQESINEKYKLLNSYGYKGRGDYLNSCSADDPELELLDIIGDINRMSVTQADEENHIKELNKYADEIKASESVLQMLEKMVSIVSSINISSIEEIDDIFEQNECLILLNKPSIINYEKIFNDHYQD